MGTSKLGDGRSGAPGNTGTRPNSATQIGSSRPQQQGSQRAPQSVAQGGPILKLDPPSLRGGLVADPRRAPFKLNAMSARPAPLVEEDDDSTPVGSVPSAGDTADDPSAEA
jgi:hypothetical protein